jgi:serine/threonine protein phosphatase PrpC
MEVILKLRRMSHHPKKSRSLVNLSNWVSGESIRPASDLARDNGYKSILSGRVAPDITMGAGTPLLAERAYEPAHITRMHRKIKQEFSVLEFDNRNCRGAMEDWVTVTNVNNSHLQGSLFIVCDGHGIPHRKDAENASRKIARYVAEQIPIVLDECLTKTEGDPIMSLLRATKTVDQSMRVVRGTAHSGIPEAVRCGTTMTAVLVGGDRVYIANVGDSRAVICGSCQADQLTVDHNMSTVRPDDVQRMEANGVKVARGRAIVPEYGGLAVARTLGNFAHAPGPNAGGHRGGVSSTPDVFEYQILSGDQFLVIACDGVWDVIKNSEVAELICDCTTSQMAADLIMTTVKARGTSDNVSLIVVSLN